MKKYVLIAGVAVLVSVVVLASVLLSSFQGQPLPTSLEEPGCVLPVTVQGPSMEPAIKAGTRLLLDKCADKQGVPVGAIVLFDENDVRMVGRVKERIGLQQAVSYRIAQDGGQRREFTVPSDKIIAVSAGDGAPASLPPAPAQQSNTPSPARLAATSLPATAPRPTLTQPAPVSTTQPASPTPAATESTSNRGAAAPVPGVTKPSAARLFVDGKPFEFSGAFIPGWYWGQRTDQTDIRLLDSVKEAGFTVLHVMPPILDDGCGIYNERVFNGLDFFLSEASKRDIRVIIPFIHGIGMTQPGYKSCFYSPYGIETLVKNQDIKNAFVQHMKTVATRVNTITGLTYSEDPTILGWEIIEEPVSGDHNYPLRPPAVTHYEIRQWLDEMARALKAVDSHHLVGVQFTAAGEGSRELEDKSLSVLETPSLDFIEIEDGDARVLQTERSNRVYDLAFATAKPVIMFLSFTGLSYPDPGQSVPNEARLMKVCNDYPWQADTLYSEFSAYHKKGTAGYFFFSWRSPGMERPPYDKCFSYSLDTPLIVQTFQRMSEYLGPLNAPGKGFAEVRATANQ